MTEKTPQKSKFLAGYKVKEFDWDIFANMLRIQCTQEEIAFCFGMSVDTLSRRCLEEKGKTFAELRKIFGSDGNCNLRRRLWKSAMSDKSKDSMKAAIWLSKQHLGMREAPEANPLDSLKPLIIKRQSGETYELGLYSHDQSHSGHIEGTADRGEGRQAAGEHDELATGESDAGDRGETESS